MAKDKPKNGRRTTNKPTIRGTRATPRSPQHKPTGKKDRGGFVSPGFKSEGFQSGKKTPKTGSPPSVRARDEKRAKQPPPVKYAGKKKPGPPGWTQKPIPPSWLKPGPRPKPKPKPKPGPRPPKPRPKPKPRPERPEWPIPRPGWGQQPKPGPRPQKPKPRKPKKPMGKGRDK